MTFSIATVACDFKDIQVIRYIYLYISFIFHPSIPLTKVGAAHEVLAGILWVLAHHRARDRVKAGELVPTETVVMLEPAEGGGAVGQVGPHLGFHCLGPGVIVEHLVFCTSRPKIHRHTRRIMEQC